MSAINKNTGQISLKRAKSHIQDQIASKKQKREPSNGVQEIEVKELEKQIIQPSLKKNRSTPVQPSPKTLTDTRNGSTTNEIAQILTNNKFHKELQFMYREVDKYSGLLWNTRDDFELIRYNRKEKKQNENKQINLEASKDWQNKTKASFGYGEITRGSFTTFLNINQNIDEYIRLAFKKSKVDKQVMELSKLPFDLKEYRLESERSTFLDIGSGFGKPNFHAAMQVYPKESIGIEIVPARVNYTMDQKFEFERLYLQKEKKENKASNRLQMKDLSALKEKQKAQNNEIRNKLTSFYRHNWHDCVSFNLCDAAQDVEKYQDSYGQDITHIYSYNKIMSITDHKKIAETLNRTNFKILAWYIGPRDSCAAGLKRVKLVHKMPMQSTGNQKFTVYYYVKTQLYDKENPWSDSESEASDEGSCGEEGENEQEEFQQQ